MQAVNRLISQFVPESYDLSLSLDRATHGAHGRVVISGSSVNGTIALHAKDMAIDHVMLDGQPASHSFGKDDELTIGSSALSPGKHVIEIEYHFTITELAHGMYVSRYKENGVEKELFATQLESHYAREVLPCVDEPEAKAVFTVDITTARGSTVLSNMPATHYEHSNEVTTTYFEPSPRMSSYLLAIAVGEFHKLSRLSTTGVEVNIWAVPTQPATALEYPLEQAIKCIDFYDDYFGVPYPLPKSDHLALPDFGGGAAAMENWGLVTYRQDYLLADPSMTSVESKQMIAKTIAHEISHQWFGNLVTMKWWNDLWLNESFANVMEYIALDHLYPEWQMWLDCSTYENVLALRRDSIDGVQSVQIDVNHPSEIQSIFDGAIVYAKGGRLMRMLHAYVGEEAFRSGLKLYFSRHQYANTTGDDLWNALAETSGKDVVGFMHTWISQPGYPVVSASLADGELTLTQRQFFIGPHQASTRLWPIPLGAQNESIPHTLSEPSLTIPYSDTSLRLNQDDSAHFITHYDKGLFDKLLSDVRSGNLSVLGRAQLLHEQTLLVRGGLLSSDTLIDLLEAYVNEDDEYVWDMMAVAIGELKKFVDTNEAAEHQLRTFVGRLARQQYEQLGWQKKPDESLTRTKLRTTIISCMLYSEDTEVIAEAIRQYRSSSIDQLDPELRGLIISTVVRHDHRPDDIDALIQDYSATINPELQHDICGALTSSRDHDTLLRLIGLLKDTKVIRLQDTVSWFVSLLRNRFSRQEVWDWMRREWPWIGEMYFSEKSYDSFPKYAAMCLMTASQLDEFTAFFTPMRDDPSLTRAIDMGIVDLTARVELIEKDGPAVIARLAQL